MEKPLLFARSRLKPICKIIYDKDILFLYVTDDFYFLKDALYKVRLKSSINNARDIFILCYFIILLKCTVWIWKPVICQRAGRVWPWSCQCCPYFHQWSWGCSCLYSCNHLYISRMCSDEPADGCRPKTEQECLVAHGHLVVEILLNYLLMVFALSQQNDYDW